MYINMLIRLLCYIHIWWKNDSHTYFTTSDNTSELSFMTKSTRSMKLPVRSEQNKSFMDFVSSMPISDSLGSTVILLPKTAFLSTNVKVPGIGPAFLQTSWENNFWISFYVAKFVYLCMATLIAYFVCVCGTQVHLTYIQWKEIQFESRAYTFTIQTGIVNIN